MLTIEQIQKEFYYCTGQKATAEEAQEILGFIEDNRNDGSTASIDEIISDYYYAKIFC